MLGTIEEELSLCRKALESVSVVTLCWCIHHEYLIEELNEPPEGRIFCIVLNKPKNQQALRLHEFRPVKSQGAKDIWAKRKSLYDQYSAKLKTLYEEYQTKPRVEQWEVKRKPLDEEYERERKSLDDELERLHKEEIPDTKWNGKELIFS